MSNIDDLENAMQDVEYGISELESTQLSEVLEAVEKLQSKYNDAERELGYVKDDLEELEGFQGTGFDVDDIEGMEQEIEDLKAEIKDRDDEDKAAEENPELVNLRKCHEQQRLVISGLLEFIRDARRAAECNAGLLSEDAVVRCMVQATTPTTEEKTDG